MKKGKIICKTAAAAMAAACLVTGCGPQKKTAESGSGNKLTYWGILNTAVSQTMSNMGETPIAKELQKHVGTDIEYIHPPIGQEVEKFNLMIASNDLPDIIFWAWVANYTGGPSKAIKEKRIISLNDYKDDAPNFFKVLAERENVDKLSKTDSGDYFGFTSIKGEDSLPVSDGLILRKDWLDELGLEIPETIEEWETVLRAFKSKKGAAAPISCRSWGLPPFASAFNVIPGYYVEDGKVICGYFEQGYKDYVSKMHDWYEEGLIDKDIATIDDITVNSNIIKGVSGVTYNSIGSGIGRYMNASKEKGYELVGAPYPVKNKGDKREYVPCGGDVPGGYAAAISTSCKNIPLAMKVLDYGYSEEGHMLLNFGIEGESYEMKDGYPTYTSLITNNKDGLSLAETLGRYTLASQAAPIVQDARYMEQYAALPSQKKTLEIWKKVDSVEKVYPQISPKEEYLNEYARLTTDVNTYISEMFMKFVMGVEPMDNFNSFLDELRKRGIDRITEIRQETLDSFNAR